MSKERKEKKKVTRAEVAKHNTPDDLWIIVRDKVYAVPENWLGKHPGGRLCILSIAGKDATEPFVGFHNDNVFEDSLKYFHTADLIDFEVEECVREFRQMQIDLQHSDLYQTDYLWYAKMIGIEFLMLIVAVAGVIYSDSFLIHCLSALLLGFFWQQLAFIGHDFCHNAFTHNRYVDCLLSSTLAMFKGVSAQWWKHTHNVHHVVTNSLEFDPDIQHLPVIAVTEKYFNSIKSLFHGRVLPFDAASKFFVSYQHYLYYPIMGFSRWNLYLQSFLLHFKAKDRVPFRIVDFSALIGFWVWYITLLSFLPSTTEIIVYIFLSHFFGPGLLAIQITISHFAMPVYEDVVDESTEYKFLETQFEHSMDVDCDPMFDWLHGGLQFQAVHHLLPRIPRHNLRKVRDEYIVPFARKHGFKYNINDFYKSNIIVLETLGNTAEAAKRFPPENLAK